MSFNIQNTDSVKQAIFEELQNLLSSDTETLHQAEIRMKQLEYTEGYGVYLSELIMNQSFELPLRQIACIMLTRYVEEHWGICDENGKAIGDKATVASEQVKRAIRNILPNGLYDPNSKVRSSVAHTISAIAASDWPHIWTELFNIIIKCLGGNEDSIHGAMQILKDFSYDAKQIKELGPIIIAEVYRIFESDQQYSISTRTSAITILKPLFLSICINIQDKQEEASMMNSILENFMNKLLFFLSMNSGTSSNFQLRAEIVRILTFLVTEMPKYIHPYMDRILPIIWQLLTQIAETYVKVVVNEEESFPFNKPDGSAQEEDALIEFTAMIIQIFEFVQCVIISNKFRSTIKNVLTDLIYIIIVYIQVSEEQILDWNEDPEKFVEDEDESGVELTIRLSGQDILVALNDELGVKVLPALQEALRRHMNVAEAEKANGNPHWWKIQEACMVAVHAYRDLILETKEFDLLNYLSLVRNLLNCQDSAHLVGRALWTLSTYSKSELYNPQMLEDILAVTLESLSIDKSIVLKICAVRAVHGFVQAHQNANNEKRVLIQTKLPGFVEGILHMIPGCKSSVLALSLEALTIIILFDSALAATMQSKLVPLAIAVFLKYPEDPYLLEIVQDMIKALSQNANCLQLLQEKFIPTIVSILSLQENNASIVKQDVALDILTTIVRYSPAPLTPILIDTAFPAMVHCVLRTDDHSIMVAGGECLRAFIFVSPEQICSYNNGEGLNFVMQLTTILLNPMNNEMTAGQIGRLVITIISKMGNMLGENIDLLLKAVISKMQLVECLKVIMSLVVIFAHLFLTQMDAVLNFLSTVPGPTGEPALQFVLSSWLAKQISFFGSYERKVTTMALCKLFEYGITTQDSRLTCIEVTDSINIEHNSDTRIKTRSQAAATQQWIKIPALVKVFKLLINELKYLKEVESAGYETVSDDDDNQQTNSSPSKSRYVSDLYFEDDEEDHTEDDQLMQELLKDPLFQANMEENLTKFLRNFSNSEHFASFANHLDLAEKNLLKSIDIICSN